MDYPSTSKRSMDENYLSMKSKIKQEKKLAKLKKKYGHVNNFVKQKEQPVEEKTKNQHVNVGYLSSKKLKDKLENIEAKIVQITKKKKNRNGKVGINKNINYTPDKHAPRKVCYKCGSSNHLAMQCKTIVPPAFSQSCMLMLIRILVFLPKCLSCLILIIFMEMQACHLCHGEHQLSTTLLHIHIPKMLYNVILSLMDRDYPLR